jgi:GTPase SAR1 family protein
MRRLILVRGLPGSGKTTIAKALIDGAKRELIAEFGEDDAPIHNNFLMCAADDFFYADGVCREGTIHYGPYEFDPNKLRDAHDECQRKAFGAMMDDSTLVVVHNTFSQMWEMTPYLAMAKVYDYSIQVIECKGGFGSVHGVPDEAIDRMRARWEEYSND